jgi:hypothetical protein
MFDISLAPVLVATLASVVVGMVWYSHACFGAVWAREAKMSHLDAEIEKLDDAHKRVIASLLQNFVIIYLLAHIMLLADAYRGLPPHMAVVWVLIIILASHSGSVIWEKRSLTYFAINAGYMATTLLLASVIIVIWPWS